MDQQEAGRQVFIAVGENILPTTGDGARFLIGIVEFEGRRLI